MNEDDFRQLILAELDAVHRLACHLARDRQESDDCVQETYLRALRSRETFTLGEYGVRPWLFKILHNVILGRGAKRQREREILGGLPADPDVVPPTLLHDGTPIDWEDVDERLKVAIAELPLAYRATFLLSVVEGLKYREIADVTDVPIGTVTSRLARARVALATRLADLATEMRIGERSEEASERP